MSHRVIPNRLVDIDNCISQVTDRFIQQILDIEPRFGQTGRDLADHVRDIRIGNRNSPGIQSWHSRLGKIDRISDIAILQVILDVLCHHDRAVLLRLGRRSAQVRQGNDFRVRDQFGRRKIADVSP